MPLGDVTIATKHNWVAISDTKQACRKGYCRCVLGRHFFCPGFDIKKKKIIIIIAESAWKSKMKQLLRQFKEICTFLIQI